MSSTSVNFNVPKDAKGKLMWMFIDGEGKKDLQGNPKFTAQVELTPEEAAPYIAEVEEYWEENRQPGWKYSKAEATKLKDPKLAGTPKPAHSLGFLENEDGNFVFNFKTNPTYADGTAKVIDIYNARASKISLGGKKIGNGSLGALSGIMDVYDGGGNQGVTLYLNAVQLTKFIEFSQDAGFETQEEGFEGVDNSMTGFENTEESEAPATPRL